MADKQLEATTAASAFQKQWFADLRRRVFDERQPYALLQADVPFELFDLARHSGGQQPVVGGDRRRQTPGAAVSGRDGGRRLPRRAVPLLQPRLRVDALSRRRRPALGRTADAARCSAPGSPATAFIASSSCGPRRSVPSCSRSIIPGAGELPPRWWELGRHRWRELVEPHRLAFVVADPGARWSSVSRRSAVARSIAMRCASGCERSISRKRSSTRCAA